MKKDFFSFICSKEIGHDGHLTCLFSIRLGGCPFISLSLILHLLMWSVPLLGTACFSPFHSHHNSRFMFFSEFMHLFVVKLFPLLCFFIPPRECVHSNDRVKSCCSFNCLSIKLCFFCVEYHVIACISIIIIISTDPCTKFHVQSIQKNEQNYATQIPFIIHSCFLMFLRND